MRKQSRFVDGSLNPASLVHRACFRDRTVTFKNIEIDEEISSASIPIIEEILASILFSAFVKWYETGLNETNESEEVCSYAYGNQYERSC